MFKEIMSVMDADDNEMKEYLNSQVMESEQEIEVMKKKLDNEKNAKIREMEAEKERKMKELMERQERMFDWEAKVRKDEDKAMEAFRKQKEDLLAKKLAEQQKEILRDMNKKDVDALLERHKSQLLAMDEALEKEQDRQMERMRERLKGRGKANMKEKMMKQIKLAEIQKQRQAELEKA
jgi:hypothetical protein